MKIGIDIRALDTDYVTGVDTYLRSILRQWLKINHRHKFILFGTKRLKGNEIVKDYLSGGHDFVVQPWPNKIFNSFLAFLNYPKLDKVGQEADIYFLPNPIFWSFSKNVPVVATFHDLAFKRLQNIYSLKRLLWHKAIGLEKLASRADRILAVSEATKRDLVRIYQIPGGKITVTHLGVDGNFADQSRQELSCPPARPSGRPENYILFIGSIEPRKNLKSLLQAFARLGSRFPDLHLVVAGGFSPQKDREVMHEMEKNPKIIFAGPVKDSEKMVLYKNARALVLPSLYEGFGLQIAEGFVAGVPVITSVSSSMPEVAKDSAILVNPFNSADLALAIEGLLTNSSFRGTLVSQGKELANDYDWRKTARRTLEIIENTANAHNI